MKLILSFIISFLIAGMPVGWSQTRAEPDSGSGDTKATESGMKPLVRPANPNVQAPQAAVPTEKTNWSAEFGGSFAAVTNNYGEWYSGDAKITYTGSKYFAPSLSFGSQTRPEGNQQAYGLGSYVNFGKYGYAIVGVGVAPNHGAILYPNFRYDVMGVVPVPPVKGLLMTGGYGSYRMGGGSAKTVSVGSIFYYKKVILNGGVSFNRSYPGSLPSNSGFFSLMAGRQGKYWIGAGASGGNLHYKLMGMIPYDVRGNAYGFNAFMQKWVGKNWGINTRYYFTNVIDSYISNSIGISFFFEF
jgi:YaiO family outer membrane protein